MIDVHCHLNFHAFEKDYEAVIKRAFDAGVTKIINVGTKIDSSKKAVELAKNHKNLYAIVGVHPHHADNTPHPNPLPRGERENLRIPSPLRGEGGGEGWIEQLENIAKHPKVVGIGECGMDYYRYKSNDIVASKLQKEVFIKQIGLTYKLKLPLQIPVSYTHLTLPTTPYV